MSKTMDQPRRWKISHDGHYDNVMPVDDGQFVYSQPEIVRGGFIPVREDVACEADIAAVEVFLMDELDYGGNSVTREVACEILARVLGSSDEGGDRG